MNRFPQSQKIARLALVVLIIIAALGTARADKGYTPKQIDINKADTTVWISLPGIGSKLANRIVNYREKLHGFISVEQVAEVYGLPDSVFQNIKPLLFVSENSIEKVNINTASKEELKSPYINYNLANIIYQFRIQHGAYQSLEDLKKIMLIDEALYSKITPYLSVK
jgi:competence protein ComEA